MTLVKLCGLCSVEDVLAANEAGPDMVGMILAPGFRRTVDIECARSMAESVREARLEAIKNLMETLKLSPIEAMNAMKIPADQQAIYNERLR